VRRVLLLIAALGVVGCGAPPEPETTTTEPTTEEEDLMTMAPWHMWGGTRKFHASTLSTGLLYTDTGQLARINYKRPESWHFMFYAIVFRSQLANPSILDVKFTVQTGVGRSNLNITPFEEFKFSLPIGAGGTLLKWSGEVNGPVRDDTAAVPPPTPAPNVVSTIVGQDIQVGVTASAQLTIVGDEVDAEFGVVLAPWHHARPDWHVHQFEGEEIRGQ
jgi:hypothetical protein